MTRDSSGPGGELRVMLWIARILAALIVVFSVLMLVGYAVNPQGNPATPDEWALLALFPIGMSVGYAIAWKWQLTGGIVSLACIIAFLIALREADMLAIVSLLAIPGILFVLYGLLGRRARTDAPTDE